MRIYGTKHCIGFVHKRCFACMVMACIPLLHFLEPFGIPHGLEMQLEGFAATLVVTE